MSGAPTGTVPVTDADWDERVLGVGTPVLVDFWAPWCAPCRKLEPALADLARRYAGRLTVASLDVDDQPATASRYGVLSLPTLILFAAGEPVERLAGAVKARRIEAAVAAHVTDTD